MTLSLGTLSFFEDFFFDGAEGLVVVVFAVVEGSEELEVDAKAFADWKPGGADASTIAS